MEKDDLVTLGRLMNESHESLKNDYEVSSRELDMMVDAARRQPGCLGARLTGAGFGGCTVSLVRDEAVDAFVEGVGREYKAQTGIEPQIYVSKAAAGASVIA
jgi:galactokinase